MSTYTKLRDACLPAIADYMDDLTVHDRRWLRQNPDIPFLHATRPMGTVLIPLWPAHVFPAAGETAPHVMGNSTRERIADGLVDMAEYVIGSERHLLFHHYDGIGLHPVTTTEFVRIVHEHRKMLADQFRTVRATGPRPAAYVLL